MQYNGFHKASSKRNKQTKTEPTQNHKKGKMDGFEGLPTDNFPSFYRQPVLNLQNAGNLLQATQLLDNVLHVSCLGFI